ncbi:Gfo/Idh/MocA family protein [Paenibacillus chungangensis]|uniref:Gfo/Idh/MocA family protein n=1 Tax=Paenibacillus chungangensis TaxID=696535 RepID=A0ABW3HWQ7_9BACL
MSDQVLKVGIIGQGRSGRNIHANLLAQIGSYYRIAAVADSMPERQQRAVQDFGCNAYATWEEMVASEELDLVVNASPSHLHFSISLELLNRGIHVLCEKPLAGSVAEVDQLIEASERAGKVIAIFQQQRYQPAFVQIQEVIKSGVLGRIVQADISLNGFARRWDWQTLQENNGGSLMNTGPHCLDQALQLLGTDENPDVLCIMDRANTFGDAEDYVKLIMRKAGSPTLDVEISSCSAYPHEQFNIQGTNGGLHGNANRLEWRYFKPEEAPEQKLIKEPLFDANGNPAYCSESLAWHSDSWDFIKPTDKSPGDTLTERVYMMLYHTITEGALLEITPQQIRQQMWVMEECRRQNPHIYQTENAGAAAK